MVEGPAERLLSQFLRNLNPHVIGAAPGFQVVILLVGQRQMPPLDCHVAVQPGEHLRILELAAPVLLQLLQQEFLRIIVFRKRARGAGYVHGMDSPVPAKSQRRPAELLWICSLMATRGLRVVLSRLPAASILCSGPATRNCHTIVK